MKSHLQHAILGRSLFGRSLFHLAASALALTAACSAAPDPDGSRETAGQDLSLTCRGIPLPAPHVCATYVCDGDAWNLSPYPIGQPCALPGGAAGLCSGHIPTACLAVEVGTITPKFEVIAVEYAPPGVNSSVDYGEGQTWGTSTSNTSSWKNSINVTVANNDSFLGFAKGGLSVTAGQEQSISTKDTFDLKETMQTDFTNSGDGPLVDHGLDRIFLWLDPQMNVTTFGNNMTWTLAEPSTAGPVGSSPIVFVTPDCLLGKTPMNPNTLAALTAAGITPADYAAILSVDPFATGSPPIDTRRYVFETEIPYEGVSDPNQKPGPSKFMLTSTGGGSTDVTSSLSYSVGAKISGSAGFIGLANASLTVADTLTVTSTNDEQTSSSTTLSATASIVQPSFGYTGPIELDVYLDTVYNTFMFALANPTIGVGPGRAPPGGGVSE